MATSDGYPFVVVVLFVSFYFLVFVLSTVGNSFVLHVCYRSVKRKPSECSLKWFIANLAVADLTFTILSIFDLISFLSTWVGGQVTCKLQSFLIEACYSASIMTLVVISFERLKAVVEPFSARIGAQEGVCRKLLALWIVSLVAASPLLYAYQAQGDNQGVVICSNIAFKDLGRQIYYSIHAVFFFLVPLIYIIYAQSSIFLALRRNVFPIQNAFSTTSSRRHRKAARPLVALTIAFVTCWSPFIIVRTLMYFHLTDGGVFWRASQLLIFLNTALDPILYRIYGENLTAFLARFFPCARSGIRTLNSTRVVSLALERGRRRTGHNSTTSSRVDNGASLYLIDV